MHSCFNSFEKFFHTRTHDVSTKALHYLKGLFKSEKNRANCTSIADSLGELDHQSLNHLLSDSPWNYKELLRELAVRVDGLFSDHEDVALLIDEVGFRKKGKYSACVGRQYLGCIGKHDNGQVAVVAGLSTGKHYCPVDLSLFMPESWQDDQIRRLKAKVPDHITHQSKPKMALEMIRDLKANNIKFNYVGFDALYGSSFSLIENLDNEGIAFIGDIKENIQISTRPITFTLPIKKPGAKGKKFKYKQVDQPLMSVKEYMESIEIDDFEHLSFRNGTKQEIRAYFHQKEVWITFGTEKTLRLQLIIRKDIDGTIKYSFTNMDGVPLIKIAKRQGQRVFVEKIFEEGKNQIGMGDYQVRSWNGFHKHMTLCFMAFYYMASQKIEYEQELIITSPVIRKLVASTIISRWENTDAAIEICLKSLELYQNQIQRNLRIERVT